MTDVSVLVKLGDSPDVFRRQLASLDAQTIAADEFEVLVDGRAASAPVLSEARLLAPHRPNVTVLLPDSDEDLMDACAGTYALSLAGTDLLFPAALQRLRDFGDEHGLDLVVGRVVEGTRPVPGNRWVDHVVDGTLATTADDVTLVRRAASPGFQAGVVRPKRSGIQGSYPSCRRTTSPESPSALATGELVLTVEDVGWRAGQLELSITASGAGLPTGEDQAYGLLQHTQSLDTRPVAAGTELEGTPESPRWHIRMTIDPLAETEPLENGLWQLLLQLGDPQDQPNSLVVAVPWSGCAAAVVDQVPLIPASLQGRFSLDIGAVTRPLVYTTNPSQGSVTESVRGSLLVLQLPSLHTQRTDTLDGFIAQDKVRMPTRIIVEQGRARLEAYLSGPKSRSRLSTEFTAERLHSTGLSLDIDGEGGMRLVRTPPPTPPKKPAATPASKAKRVRKAGKAKPTPKPPQGVAARMRRAVPEPLEPVVKRVARLALARRLYRRLTH